MRLLRFVKDAESLLRILLVEDQPADARLVREILSEAPDLESRISHVCRLREALERIAEETFDVVLLDLGLPDARGLEALRILHQRAVTLPIIVLSGLDSVDLAVQAVREGAQDYLVKGTGSAPLLVRAIRYAIERKRLEAAVSHLAYHDGLTNLPNRRLLHDLLVRELAHAHRNRRHLAVILLDLDNFKDVNDSLGHAMGDRLLVEVAQRLRACTRRSDTMARLGGDEFTLVLPEISRPSDVSWVADKVSATLRHPFLIEGHELLVSASIGTSVYPGDGEDAETLMRSADRAMYRAKGRRRAASRSRRFLSTTRSATTPLPVKR